MSTHVDLIREIPKGLTRDCLWPWNYIEVRPNGDVAPCCVRPAIGNVQADELHHIMNAEPVRRLREDLLGGTPDGHCRACLLAPLTTPESLRAKIRAGTATDA